MTIQLSDTIRDSRNDTIESTIGTSAKLQLRTGAQPADCETANSGTLLCTLSLPSDWMGASSNGVKAKAGTWTGTVTAAGTAAHYRLFNNAETVCGEQGSITITGSGGDLTLDNNVLAVDQVVTINTWTKTDGNA